MVFDKNHGCRKITELKNLNYFQKVVIQGTFSVLILNFTSFTSVNPINHGIIRDLNQNTALHESLNHMVR